MSCFNTLKFPCPNCEAEIEYQSKAGSCEMETFPLEECPIQELAEFATYGITCGSCKVNIFPEVLIQMNLCFTMPEKQH